MIESVGTFISNRIVGEVAVFDIQGEFTRVKSPDPTLYQLVRTQLETGKRRILINFEKVGFVDTFAVQQLVAGFTSVERLGGQFRICNVSPQLAMILRITGLAPGVIDFHPTEAAAMDSFSKTAAGSG